MDAQIAISVVDKTQRALKNIDRRLNNLQKSLIGTSTLAKTAALAFAGFAAGKGVSSILSATQAMEGFRTQLTTYLGSQQLANAEIARLSKLARSLPQDVNQLTEAFVIFQRFGLDTSNDSMRAFSNIAAANSKSITQLGEAVADALTGEFERLKEFGIKVTTENGKFTAKIGEDQVAVATTTSDLIEQLKALGAEGGKFGKVTIGPLTLAMSNFRGALFETSAALGEGGLGKAIADTLNKFTDLITKNDEAVAKIGDALTKAFLYAVEAGKFLFNNIELLAKAFGIIVGINVALWAIGAATSMATFATTIAKAVIPALAFLAKGLARTAMLALRHPLIGGIALVIGGIEYFTGALSNLAEKFGLIGDESVMEDLVNEAKALGNTIAGPVVGAVQEFDDISRKVNEQFAKIKQTAEDANKPLTEAEAILLKQELRQKAINEAEASRIEAFNTLLEQKQEDLRVSTLSEQQQLSIKLIKEAEQKIGAKLGVQQKQKLSDLARETIELEKQQKLKDQSQKFLDDALAGTRIQRIINEANLKQIAEFAKEKAKEVLDTEYEIAQATAAIDAELQEKLKQNRLDTTATVFAKALEKRREFHKKELQLFKQFQVDKENMEVKIGEAGLITEIGRQERLQEAINSRIEFEKKSEAEKYQFAIGQASSFFKDLATVNKKFARVAKAAAIVEATINTYVGATKALAAYPPPFNFIAAAAVVASGLAQVATIRAQTAQRGGNLITGGPAVVGEDGPELIVPKQPSTVIPREVAQAIDGMGGRNQPVTVNFNITANDTAGFDQLITQRRGLIVNLINTALNERGKAGITA